MFGQIVIGPPGSGKTTYCKAIQEFLKAIGRKVKIVNLDPANDPGSNYQCAIDVNDLITVEETMTTFSLGPNGALVYCMQYLQRNADWLEARLDELAVDDYVLFDCPGQVELYTHHECVRDLFARLSRSHHLVAVHLVDSLACRDAAHFVAVTMTSLLAMIRLELPHVNILSKADTLESNKRSAESVASASLEENCRLPFNLDYFTEVLDMRYLTDLLQDDPFFKRFKKLNEAIAGIIEDYSLVSFIPVSVENRESLLKAIKSIDKANGYVFGTGEQRSLDALLSVASAAEFQDDKTSGIQEKYMDIIRETERM